MGLGYLILSHFHLYIEYFKNSLRLGLLFKKKFLAKNPFSALQPPLSALHSPLDAHIAKFPINCFLPFVSVPLKTDVGLL